MIEELTFDAAPQGQETDLSDSAAVVPRRRAPIIGSMPQSLIFTEHAVASLRAFVAGNGDARYRIFHGVDIGLDDVEDYLEPLGESSEWEPLPPMSAGGEPLSRLTYAPSGARIWQAGVLWLARHGVYFARWYWRENDEIITFRLCAAASADDYFRLRRELIAHRHALGIPVWQVVTGNSYRDASTLSRTLGAGDDMMMSPVLRRRVEADIVGFFTDSVRALYHKLRVPYRRGVLLHGPPGNGKTSLIRAVGATLPRVRAFLLRPDACFDDDDLQAVITRWREEAPAILAIEDLDWFLGKVNISTFLNLIDGVDSDSGDGLLLIATTNHPDKLDPAINNRPGRFDVVIEVQLPDEEQRLVFLTRALPEVTDALLRDVARRGRGFSFAHLQEIVRLSGMLAIHANRADRTDRDVNEAAELQFAAQHNADRGFPMGLDMPFGLARCTNRRACRGRRVRLAKFSRRGLAAPRELENHAMRFPVRSNKNCFRASASRRGRRG